MGEGKSINNTTNVKHHVLITYPSIFQVRQRRESRKEKVFQAELTAEIREAEKFSAEAYVAEKIRKATETPIPRFWKGKRLPQFIIKEKLEQEEKWNTKKKLALWEQYGQQ